MPAPTDCNQSPVSARQPFIARDRSGRMQLFPGTISE